MLLSLAVSVFGVAVAHDTEDGGVLVPQETLRFMLGCQRDRALGGSPDVQLPVFHTDIDTKTGTTSQKVALLDTDQLRQSLRSSVHSAEVLDLIIGRLEEVVQGAAAAATPAVGNANSLRQEAIYGDLNTTTDDRECTINNNIDISVPAQEVDRFNDRVQMLIQQNSFLLLEQINTLFTYKLRSLREDFENMVRERTKKINRKLDAVLEALGTTVPAGAVEEEEATPPSGSEATVGTSSEVEVSTDAPGVSGEEEETTEEPSTDITEEEEEEDITRNESRLPVASPEPARPNRYQSRRPSPSSRPRPSQFRVRPQADRQTPSQAVPPSTPLLEAPIDNRARKSQLQRRRLSLMNSRKRKGTNHEAKETEK